MIWKVQKNMNKYNSPKWVDDLLALVVLTWTFLVFVFLQKFLLWLTIVLVDWYRVLLLFGLVQPIHVWVLLLFQYVAFVLSLLLL